MKGGKDLICPQMMKGILQQLSRPFGVRGLIAGLTTAVLFLAVIGIAPDEAAALKKQEDQPKKEGYLGVTMQSLTDEVIQGLDLKVRRGVLISEVVEDSPAEEAGLQDGDVIIGYDGKTITSPEELSKLVKATAAGGEIKLKIVRADDNQTLVVTIGEKPEELAWTAEDDDQTKNTFVRMFEPGVQLGVKIQDLDNKDFAAYFDVKEDEGVLVMGVEEESSADEAGVKAGDVILRLNDEDINTSEELVETVREMGEGDEFELVVKRHGQAITLTGAMKEGKGLQSLYFYGDKPHLMKGKDLRLHLDGDQIEELKPKLKKLQRHMVIERDDVKAELKELKEELRKLKERLEELEK